MKMRICYANLFLLSFLIGQDTLTHIIKTYPDGTPKAAITSESSQMFTSQDTVHEKTIEIC